MGTMTTQLLQAIFGVFEDIGTWIITFLSSVTDLFWTTTTDGTWELTFLGVLALVGLGISVIFLMIRVVQNFLHFRG